MGVIVFLTPVMNPALLYKIFYNLVQTLGWSFILYSVVMNYVRGQGPEMVWPKVGEALIIFQNAALLEVLHSLVGLVRAPVGTTFIQVMSRVLITYFCMEFPECREGYIFTMLMISWSVIEIVRYSFYVTDLLDVDFYPHKWLRYSLFVILYPSGVFSEIATLYFALPAIQRSGLFGVADFPVGPLTLWTITIFFLIFLYVPGFPVMFGHMVTQRKKKLAVAPPPSKASTKKKTK